MNNEMTEIRGVNYADFAWTITYGKCSVVSILATGRMAERLKIMRQSKVLGMLQWLWHNDYSITSLNVLLLKSKTLHCFNISCACKIVSTIIFGANYNNKSQNH